MESREQLLQEITQEIKGMDRSPSGISAHFLPDWRPSERRRAAMTRPDSPAFHAPHRLLCRGRGWQVVFSCGLCGQGVRRPCSAGRPAGTGPGAGRPLRQSSTSTGAGTAASGSATSTLTKIAACAPGARPASAPPAALGSPPETNFVPSAAPSSLSPAAVPEPSKEKAGPFLLCMRHRLGDRKRHRDPLHPRCGKAIPRTSVRNHIGWLFGDGGMGVAILIWLAGTGLANSLWTAPWAIATSAAWSAVQAPAREPSGALPSRRVSRKTPAPPAQRRPRRTRPFAPPAARRFQSRRRRPGQPAGPDQPRLRPKRRQLYLSLSYCDGTLTMDHTTELRISPGFSGG